MARLTPRPLTVAAAFNVAPPPGVSVTIMAGAAMPSANPLAVKVTVLLGPTGDGVIADSIRVRPVTAKAFARVTSLIPVTVTVRGPIVAPGKISMGTLSEPSGCA